jgi:bacillithiol biosynthesis cysteine-adding enzyme BshC
MLINFGDIPGHYNLFLDYLYDFDNVKDFYKHDFRNKESYPQVFKNVSETKREFRSDIPKIIEKQYDSFNQKPSAKTSRNISLLKDKKTLAVVTGQQLGILGGPLYTIYKTITAIKLTSYLKERYDEYQFVPLFWLEGDDHDFDEVRSVNLLNESNELVKISYDDEIAEDEFRNSVGYMTIKNTITNFIETLDKNLRKTEFKPQLIEKIKSIYAEGKLLKQSFKEILFWLFDEHGLIIFDPQDIVIKNLLRPVFKKEIDDFRAHSEKLVNRSAKLEETYHAQVKVRPINLFCSNEEGRFLLEPVENVFRLKRKKKRFTYEELTDLLDKHPESFSSNVLLRTICQDYLLPTAFYIGGPSEISYFAQVFPLYEFYGIEQPIIYPRASATLLEKNIDNLLKKHDLSITDIFVNTEELKKKIINSISETSVEEIFGEVGNQIDLTFDKLKERLFEFDKTIADASIRYKQKAFSSLDELKSKAIEAQKKKHEITLRQIDKISNSLFPNSSLQEREFNFVYFYNKYGNEFLNKIFEELSINKFEHQAIKL